MPKNDEQTITDPVVVAALIEDPTDTDEEKELDAQKLAEAEETDKAELGLDDEEEDEEADDADKTDKTPKAPDAKKPGDKVEKPEDEGKPEDKAAKPAKSDEGKPPEGEEEDQDRTTRKEKREQRRQEFLDSLKPKTRQLSAREQLLAAADPNYKPLDYESADKFNTADLAKDRELYGQNAMARGAALERHYQTQERYWERTKHEEELLYADPKYAFLNEEDKEHFNPDRAEIINGLFTQLIGYKETPIIDRRTGLQMVDPTTGQPMIQSSVARTDLSYKDFVKGYIENMEEFAEETDQRTAGELAQARAHQGIRPGGGKGNKRTKTNFRPGSFATMTDDEFDDADAESDEQILSAFA
jgi:hypothetical protein